MKETNHDYHNCIMPNHYDNKVNGVRNSWDEFINNYLGFYSDNKQKYDDTYHFVFRYDIHKQIDNNYTLELCIMFQRKGIYSHLEIKNISQEELDTDVKLWLKGRLKYLESLWEEVKEE